MRPRNPNVAEQNAAVGEEIARLTDAFRGRRAGYPAALYDFLFANGVDVSRSVLVSASTAEQGINPICGLVLTQDGRFMNFDLDCTADGREVVEVHEWADDTARQNLDARNPGFGKGVGRVALELLRRSGNAG
jgi:hypothetical protein